MSDTAILERLKQAQKDFKQEEYILDLKTFSGDHTKQYDFIASPNKRVVASCSRRAGKSTGESARLVSKAMENAGSDVYYVCSTRDDAEAIMWDVLLELCDKVFGPTGYIKNITKLQIKLPNRSRIKVTGCPDVASIKKFLGRAYSHVTIDECQDFQPELLKRLINKAIIPALIDYQGSIAMIGTPPMIHAGPFYEAFHNSGKFKGWEKHGWTMADNPWLERKAKKTAQEILQDELDRRELDEPDAEMKREFLGLWVQGNDELVYRYSPDKNTYDVLPDRNDWTFVLGIDLGYRDETAFTIVAYCKHLAELYLIDDFAKPGMDITDIANEIKTLAATYDIATVVIDSATGGANWVEEVNRRYGVYAVTADKTDKEGFIKTFNDCLRKGVIKVKPDAHVIKEWMKLGWRTSINTGKRKEDPNLPNHLCDAFLYAWRHCYQYMWVPEPKAIEVGSNAWEKQRIKTYLVNKEKENKRNGQRKPRKGNSKRWKKQDY